MKLHVAGTVNRLNVHQFFPIKLAAFQASGWADT
jgi:hypothetical protein